MLKINFSYSTAFFTYRNVTSNRIGKQRLIKIAHRYNGGSERYGLLFNHVSYTKSDIKAIQR